LRFVTVVDAKNKKDLTRIDDKKKKIEKRNSRMRDAQKDDKLNLSSPAFD